MTSTTDTTGHPDVAEISDLTEGLLPLDRSAEVRRHLEACELCADVHASLEEIRGLLGSVSEAERMPADVAGRIDAALAAEALLSASAPGPINARVTRGTGPGHESGGDVEGHVSRETSIPSDRPAGRPQAATGPGRKGRTRGRRRTRVVLGAVLTAAVLGAGSLVLGSLGDHSTGNPTAHGKPTPSVESFSGASVQSQVKDLLATKKSQQGSESGHPRPGLKSGQNTPDSTQSANTLLQTDVAVPDCVRAALHRSDDVLGAKTGTYEGKSAYLVVVPDPDGAHVTAYIVDQACIRQQPGTAGKVLLKHSFPRS
ncbi:MULTISPECIES: anti-sigma factor family protein [Streptomyces]|uniref:anti-sigma factor family protein n=1 Tax=Streptomyces TaxID=1883 RepID=UPI0004CC9EE9|nr:membrane protein [Streptomyces durhamensis]